jgi:hypothetical protein
MTDRKRIDAWREHMDAIRPHLEALQNDPVPRFGADHLSLGAQDMETAARQIRLWIHYGENHEQEKEDAR